jgi:queuine/archaeosine tRNA-ribosyltransferase
MQIVAGISLKGRKPQVWDPNSPYYLPGVKAVMISYAEFNNSPGRRKKAQDVGLHDYLNVPKGIDIYLDNGAFSIMRKGGNVPRQEYEEFVREAQPDWYPIPQDFIPIPKMSDAEQIDCLQQTMEVNRAYQHDGFVPVIHISRHLETYLSELRNEVQLSAKPNIALGGIVPNLLRAPKAMAHTDILENIRLTRAEAQDKHMHIFGIGGTATIHLAQLLGVDSVDSSGWRNRAARGIIQLPGSGERIVAELGNWRGREPSQEEWKVLEECPCPACRQFGNDGLKANKIFGFSNRATHNLWVLINEAELVDFHLSKGSYADWYKTHLDNTMYLPLIQKALKLRGGELD